MARDPVPCVNHPDTPTRLSCAVCDDPICPRCVRSSAVGQRCPSCAKPARAVAARGKPEHYARAIAAGLAVAVGGGLVAGMIGFGSLILSGVTGFGVGRAVRWGTRGQSQSPFPNLAVAVAVAGLAVAFLALFGTPVPQRGLLPLGYLVAGFLAYRGVVS